MVISGSVRPVVIKVCGRGQGRIDRHVFTTSPVRIGRNPLNDLVILAPFVSGWHAIVRFDDNHATYFDLGSTNGTRVRGHKIASGEAVVLSAGRVVQIGELELHVERGAAKNAVRSGETVVAEVGTPEKTAHVELEDAHRGIAQMRPHYDAYRTAGARMVAELQSTLARVPHSARPWVLAMAQREFPRFGESPQVVALIERMGTGSRPTTEAGPGEAVSRLARTLCPGEAPPKDATEVDGFLQRVAEVMQASVKALVELQRGQEQFGREMGVRALKEFTPLHAARTPETVLRYLLDRDVSASSRTQELVGVYADLMIHQVAMLNGVMEGVRALLAQLAPEDIERSVAGGWPIRSAALWKVYRKRHREFCDNERALAAIVFGRDFARAYAEVGGEGAG